jgi:hypothetical protein
MKVVGRSGNVFLAVQTSGDGAISLHPAETWNTDTGERVTGFTLGMFLKFGDWDDATNADYVEGSTVDVLRESIRKYTESHD